MLYASKMRHLALLLTVIVMIFYSCSGPHYSDQEMEQRAIKVSGKLGDATLDTFRHWGYGTRGNAEIWQKLDTPAYYCFYSDKSNLMLLVVPIENFKKEFPFTITIDTSIVHHISFRKINNNEVTVSALTNFGKDTTLVDKIKLKGLFPRNNPFKFFTRLTKLKNNLQIVGTFYRPDIGNFIEFYLNYQYVLTYFPDTLQIDPKYKNVWIKDFSTGKRLSKNWNLRKLKEPSDNG